MDYLFSTTPAATAALQLQQTLEQHHKTPILLLVSGGSWLSVLDLLPPQLCSLQLTLGVLDERYDTNPASNNFALLMRTTFFATAKTCGVDVIDTRVQPDETATELATRYAQTIQAWQKDNPNGVIIATLGMGEDGHTAGIMPGYVAELDTNNFYALAYTVPTSVNPYPNRVTVTPYFLRTQVTAAVAYVAGPTKCKQLTLVRQSKVRVEAAPARLWEKMRKVTVVTDCAV